MKRTYDMSLAVLPLFHAGPVFMGPEYALCALQGAIRTTLIHTLIHTLIPTRPVLPSSIELSVQSRAVRVFWLKKRECGL